MSLWSNHLWPELIVLIVRLKFITLALGPPSGPSVSKGGAVVQSNNVEGIEVYSITAAVGDNDHTLRQENELRIRNRVLVATGCDYSEWSETSFKPCTNPLDVHNESSTQQKRLSS